VPVPEQIPTVFQATHHSIGAAYGIVCKIKRRCTIQIWDHAISWRESNMYLSASQCTFPPFVRLSLIGLMRLAAHLNYHHADVILPCTDYFNPGWETELGSCEGTLVHRKKFGRKLDPVVNGICNMQNFPLVKEIATQSPTVTMLSHVQFTKDVKTALLAADVIINKWGFRDYKLEIYGSLDRTPSYTVECQEIIASKSLREFVSLKGYGNSAKVFADTWVFMNSSVSEGLPLAIGEAALTGAPIVCTDVGATFQVVSDPKTKKRYGAVVPPNDPEALARAQIAMLAVMDEWAEYAEDEVPCPPTPEQFTPEDVEWITRRMYEKRTQRQKVGSQLRSIVESSFSGDRYLREHEQMLWLGRYKNEVRLAERNSDTVIEMLDDMYTGMELREYRPEFLRHVSGYSAFGSSASDFRRSTMSVRTTSFLLEDTPRRQTQNKMLSPLLSPTRAWLMSTGSSSSGEQDGDRGPDVACEYESGSDSEAGKSV
jgi:glycosyltransferase involved in cell wall biosynthesis